MRTRLLRIVLIGLPILVGLFLSLDTVFGLPWFLHWSRYLAAIVPPITLIWFALVWCRWKPDSDRGAACFWAVGIGVPMGVAGWWFIPTFTGWNLYAAQDRSRTLATLLESDSEVSLKRAALADAHSLLTTFPNTRETLARHRDDSFRRALDRVEHAYRPVDFQRELDHCRLIAELFPDLGPQIDSAEQKWVNRTLERYLIRLEPPGRATWPAFTNEQAARSELATAYPETAEPLRRAEADWLPKAVASQVEALSTAKVDGLEAFTADRDFRGALAERFPGGRPQLADGEKAWVERAVAQQEKGLHDLPPAERDRFSEGRSFRQQLVKWQPTFAKQIEASEKAWLEQAVVHQEHGLRDLPFKDVKRFRESRPFRQQLVDWHPSSADRFREAETRWLSANLAEVLQSLESTPVGTRDFLSDAPRRGELRVLLTAEQAKQLADAENAWRSRTVAHILAEANKTPTEPLRTLATLESGLTLLRDCDAGRLSEPITEPLRKIVDDQLESAKRQTQDLVRADRYQALAALARKVDADIGKAARLVDRQKELEQYREGCLFLADLAVRAGKTDPK